MFVLLMIVILAVMALWLSNSEQKHFAALIVVGVLSIALGGRIVALLSDDFADECIGLVYAEEEYPPVELPVYERQGGPDHGRGDHQDGASAVHVDSTLGSPSKQVVELTLEPTPRFRYLTTPRPDWLEAESTNGEDVYQIAVESGLHVRKRTAQQALRDAVKAAVNAYVNDYLESELASTLAGYSIEETKSGESRTISLRLDDKTFEIARERFDEQVEFDYGVMNQSHALIRIDKSLQNALEQRWSKVRATSRLLQTGLGAGAILLLLGTMFSYLRLDTATRGYYTGRLQFAAAAAILAIIAAGVVCANRIPWM